MRWRAGPCDRSSSTTPFLALGVAATVIVAHQAIVDDRQEDLLALNDALTRLSAHNVRLAQVVECHFFGGLSLRETAEVLEINERTAERDWRRAKAYLHRSLYPDGK